MVKTLTIDQIEDAINYWRNVKPSPDGIVLPTEVRVLADVYGEMIYFRAPTVEFSTFDEKQKTAMNAALEAFGQL